MKNDTLCIESSPGRPATVSAPGLAALAMIAAACQAIGADTPANLGSTETPQVAEAPSSEQFALPITDFYGRWVGVAEDALERRAEPGAAPPAYRFPSGSSQIVLELFEWDGTSFGALTFGAGSAPPPAVDPDRGFPEGTDYADMLRYPVEGASEFAGDLPFSRGPLPPHEGLAYELRRTDFSFDAPVPDGLLRMDYGINQVFTDWCALQTPQPNPNIGFGCNGGAPVDAEGGGCELLEFPNLVCDDGGCRLDPPTLAELGPVDCDKAFLCDDAAPRCACSAEGCVAAADRAELVVRLVGGELVGTIGGASFLNARRARTPLGALRFQREP